jgi:hypothetical protein
MLMKMKNDVKINILHEIAIKNAKFCAELFGENNLKIITSLPMYVDGVQRRSFGRYEGSLSIFKIPNSPYDEKITENVEFN